VRDVEASVTIVEVPPAAVKRAVILRGLPGSGKSTLAALLGADPEHVHSTDFYFMVDGEYRFDATKLGHNHELNFKAFLQDVIAGIPLVVVDNTNTRLWEFERYRQAAIQAGYEVTEVTVGRPKSAEHQEQCFVRCEHDVRLEQIQKMGARFEP
jgi:hypothetical protein